MAILVIAEHDNKNLKDATHKTVTAALAMGGDVDVMVAGKGVKDVMGQASLRLTACAPFWALTIQS